MSLRIVPVSFHEACSFVDEWHRHHRAPQGHKFSIGAANEADELVGVAIIGRPVARPLDDRLTLEVTRMATNGTPNACSLLYGAAWRAAKALGYRRLVTYLQAEESGVSLRAVQWKIVAHLPPRRGWSTGCRPRTARGTDNVARTRWEARIAT
ncbi:XF1762 family protein [Phytohabitans suffuscus]|uniref:N-acetyltransferase domain-containing protein n=1 Tax=Phytohabitans suffuscus TaxID=624315 RepID=A0A6F8YEF3_9ACTN|nr:XF1762 family protein [Phytohabitans suffuscus]BCB84440.1 hypothetical protein Psuf_017530 [Phytohabitans suffuscus]